MCSRGGEEKPKPYSYFRKPCFLTSDPDDDLALTTEPGASRSVISQFKNVYYSDLRERCHSTFDPQSDGTQSWWKHLLLLADFCSLLNPSFTDSSNMGFYVGQQSFPVELFSICPFDSLNLVWEIRGFMSTCKTIDASNSHARLAHHLLFLTI